MKEKNHEHYFEPIAYFYAKKDEEEWLVLRCDEEDCRYTKVVEGLNIRK